MFCFSSTADFLIYAVPQELLQKTGACHLETNREHCCKSSSTQNNDLLVADCSEILWIQKSIFFLFFFVSVGAPPVSSQEEPLYCEVKCTGNYIYIFWLHSPELRMQERNRKNWTISPIHLPTLMKYELPIQYANYYFNNSAAEDHLIHFN